MNNFIFYSPTEFVFGRDTEAQTGVLVQKYGARKIMIVYGGGSVIRSGLLARVEKSLQETGIPYCMLGGVQPNPIDTKVYEGIDLCRKENVDMMLAVGGGSVIDTAKAIAALQRRFLGFLHRKSHCDESIESSCCINDSCCRKRRFR